MNKTKSLLFIILTAVFCLSACDNKEPVPNNNENPKQEEEKPKQEEENQNSGQNENPPAEDTTPLPETLSQDFTTGLGGFTVGNENRGDFGASIWQFVSDKSQYGAQATASKEVGDSRMNYAAESWLISPKLELSATEASYLYFEHAFAYVGAGSPKDYFGIKITTDGGTTWESPALPEDMWLAAYSYFELDQSGNISLEAYKGKKIQFAFVYKSTSTVAPTWEILNVQVSHQPQVIIPDDRGAEYTAVPTWMEMPQVTEAANWHAHTTILRFERVRNYSFYYNEAGLVSDWIAYPLYDQFTKSRVDRDKSEWMKDPIYVNLPQSNVHAGGSYSFSAEGYDRGHQIASADRVGGAMANQQTFYSVNVTPQLSEFNQGIWNDLEQAVRTWSYSKNGTDTMYVVSGCMVNPEGATVSDHDGQEVAIPTAYYKALLRLSNGDYLGAGFFLDHKEYEKTDSYKNYAMSLKDLEAQTGMTFFVNLPSDKATTVKAQNPTDEAFWNLK